MNRDCEILALANAQHNTFIYDRAVALQPAQGVAKRLGGRRDIIDKPDLAEVEAFSGVKAEQIVMQCVGDKRQKSDLTLRLDPSATIFNLLAVKPAWANNGATSIPAALARAQTSRDIMLATLGTAPNRLRSDLRTTPAIPYSRFRGIHKVGAG